MIIKFLDKMDNWINKNDSRTIRFLLYALLALCVLAIMAGILALFIWLGMKYTVMTIILLVSFLFACLIFLLAWELSK